MRNFVYWYLQDEKSYSMKAHNQRWEFIGLSLSCSVNWEEILYLLLNGVRISTPENLLKTIILVYQPLLFILTAKGNVVAAEGGWSDIYNICIRVKGMNHDQKILLLIQKKISLKVMWSVKKNHMILCFNFGFRYKIWWPWFTFTIL